MMRLPTILFISALQLLPVSSLAIDSPPVSLITLPTHNLTLPSFLSATEPECVRITEPQMVGLKPSNCDLCVSIICKRLSSRRPEQLLRDVWIWSELPGCALGYYLPEEAPVPPEMTCLQMFQDLVDKCALNSRYNAGGINVAEMPDFSGPGRAETEGIFRYAMAPERLTLPS